jgi:hypothetical protein
VTTDTLQSQIFLSSSKPCMYAKGNINAIYDFRVGQERIELWRSELCELPAQKRER